MKRMNKLLALALLGLALMTGPAAAHTPSERLEWTLPHSIADALAVSDEKPEVRGPAPKNATGDEYDLGQAQFATTCTPEADAKFQRALVMLHSFDHSSVAVFSAAAELDPDCAIAYWGIAMGDRERVPG